MCFFFMTVYTFSLLSQAYEYFYTQLFRGFNFLSESVFTAYLYVFLTTWVFILLNIMALTMWATMVTGWTPLLGSLKDYSHDGDYGHLWDPWFLSQLWEAFMLMLPLSSISSTNHKPQSLLVGLLNKLPVFATSTESVSHLLKDHCLCLPLTNRTHLRQRG